MRDDDDQGDELLEKGPIQPRVKGGRVVRRVMLDGVLYQAEMLTCGKSWTRKDGSVKHCRCMTGGKLHGPYWFSYTTAKKRGGDPDSGGRWRRKYLGADPPEGA